MDITARATWNARAPKKNPVKVAASRRRYFVVHHSGAPADQSVRAIQDWCMDGRDFADIDYNFLVRATTGQIYEGRGWDVVGSHTTNYNTTGIGVCVIGNNELSAAAKRSVRWLYEQANRRCGRTLEVRGHRQLATTGTDCPGDVIAAWLRAGMPVTEQGTATPRIPTTPQEAPMDTAEIWSDPTIPVTANVAALMSGNVKEGDKRAPGLLLQYAVFGAMASTEKLEKVLDKLDLISFQHKLAAAISSRDAKAIAAAIPADLAAPVAAELTARRKS